jgi:acetyltransferase-like isoleucine patch superfamily enzyme
MGSTARDRVVGKARRAAWLATYTRGPRLLSALRKRWQVFCNPAATISFGKGVYAGPGFKVVAQHGGTLIIGDGVELRRNTLFELADPGARVTVGAGSYFTYDVIVACSSTITIGERVGLGQGAYLVDGSHRFRDLNTPFLQQGYDLRPLTIANDAQIHSKVTVINDIGERAIIGANALVSKPIPPFTVAGGVPARVIDYYGPPGQEPEGWVARGS